MVPRAAQMFSGTAFIKLRLLWSTGTHEESQATTRDSLTRLRAIDLRPGYSTGNDDAVAFDLFQSRLSPGSRNRRYFDDAFHSHRRARSPSMSKDPTNQQSASEIGNPVNSESPHCKNHRRLKGAFEAGSALQFHWGSLRETWRGSVLTISNRFLACSPD